MNNLRKTLLLAMALAMSLSAAPAALAHQYKHQSSRDHYVGKFYKRDHHRYRERVWPRRYYRHEYRPFSLIDRYDGPYWYDDGLDIILRYHIYE